MNRTLRTITALSGSLVLMAVAAGTASANYSGYADGAPGPADVWAATHPDFGKVTGGHTSHAMHSHKAHSSHYRAS